MKFTASWKNPELDMELLYGVYGEAKETEILVGAYSAIFTGIASRSSHSTTFT